MKKYVWYAIQKADLFLNENLLFFAVASVGIITRDDNLLTVEVKCLYNGFI